MVLLQAGANVSLTGNNPLLSDLIVGFGWNIVQSSGPRVDLVPSAIITNKGNIALSDDHFIFFNQLSTPDDAVRYVEGGDAEQVELSLKLLNKTPAEKVVFVVYADPDVRNPGNFSSVREAYIRIADKDNTEIARFNLPQSNSSVTAMIFGEIYKHNNEWKFRAVGQGYSSGLEGVAKDFQVGL